MKSFPQWRIMVLPDHPTNIATRKHGYAPTPFAIAGTGITAASGIPYSEKDAASTALSLENGHDLMPLFLRV